MPASFYRRWTCLGALLGVAATAWFSSASGSRTESQSEGSATAATSGPACQHGCTEHNHSAQGLVAQTVLEPAVPADAPRADPSLVQRVETRLETPLLELASQPVSAAKPLRVRLPLRPNQDFIFVAHEHEKLGADQGVFTGEIEGRAGTLVVLSYVGLAQAGTVQLPDEGRAFRIRGRDDGSVRIEEVNLANAPECGSCLVAQTSNATHAHP